MVKIKLSETFCGASSQPINTISHTKSRMSRKWQVSSERRQHLPKASEVLRGLGNSNLIDLKTRNNILVLKCLTALLLMDFGMSCQSVSLEHQLQAKKLSKYVLNTCLHMIIKLPNQSFGLQCFLLQSVTLKVLGISATLSQAPSPKVCRRAGTEKGLLRTYVGKAACTDASARRSGLAPNL
jgi:hypothetical protein